VTLEVARGNGPVDALAKALKKALIPKYPMLQQLELRDYKVDPLYPRPKPYTLNYKVDP
jgi:2-isopropylmalate synthase